MRKYPTVTGYSSRHARKPSGSSLSVGLRHGVPLASLVEPVLGLYCVPNGYTDDPEIPRVRSAVDYFARRLAVDWLPTAERAALGVFTLSERTGRADRRAYDRLARPCRSVMRETTRSMSRGVRLNEVRGMGDFIR